MRRRGGPVSTVPPSLFLHPFTVRVFEGAPRSVLRIGGNRRYSDNVETARRSRTFASFQHGVTGARMRRDEPGARRIFENTFSNTARKHHENIFDSSVDKKGKKVVETAASAI
jgi:hypothetical protein